MSLNQLLSRSIAALMDCKIPLLKNLLISLFIAYYKPNMKEALDKNISSYDSFNDFFARRLKVNARPLATSPFVSPCDGRLKDAGRISQGIITADKAGEDDSIPTSIKGTHYSIATLLGLPQDSPLVSKFSQGQYANIYLAPKDYHRVHFPCDIQVHLSNFIPGSLHPVNDKSVAKRPSLYAYNQRLACIGNTEQGMLAVVMVAALFVSSIGTSWGSNHRATAKALSDKQERKFSKGDELGSFYMGSSVVLLLESKNSQLTQEHGSNLLMGQELYKI